MSRGRGVAGLAGQRLWMAEAEKGDIGMIGMLGGTFVPGPVA